MNRESPPRLFLAPPHMGGEELNLVRAAFDSNYVAPLGPMVDRFEHEFASYVGVPFCLALSSGTAAMHLALRHLDVGPGDTVLASTLTFIGSVSSAIHLGASLTFIDADFSSWNMDPELLSEELADCAKKGTLPRAVVPTDLYGHCADLPRIRQICSRYEIPVVVDSAEALGAHYLDGSGSFSRAHDPPCWVHSGRGADAAIYSFNGNKIITTGGGGMLASSDRALIDHARKLSQQARDPFPYYEHSEIGYNYRLSNVLAAIGCGQLAMLDQRVRQKRRIFECYRILLGNLPGLVFMPETPCCRSNRWLTVILLNPDEFGATPEQVRQALEAENIESRPVWKPMHLQPVFKHCRVRGGQVSEELFAHGLCLPSGTAMTDSDIERVAEVVYRCSKPRIRQL